MKTKLFLLTLLCLLLFAVTGLTQPRIITTPDGVRQLIQYETIDDDDFESVIKHYKKTRKNSIRKYWHNGIFNDLASGWYEWEWFHAPELLTALDISDAQSKELMQKLMIHYYHNESPELQDRSLEHSLIVKSLIDSDDLQHIDEERIERINKLFERRRKETLILYSNVRSRVVEDALTPEQKQKINEIHAALLGKLPIISARAFDVLDLTDAQRLLVKHIKDELEPEFEKYLEDVVENQTKWMVALQIKFDNEIDETDRNHPERENAFMEQLIAETPEFRKGRDEIQTRINAFATLFKTRVFDVLTDEQRKRHQELTDNPPEHVRIFLNRYEKDWGGWGYR